MPSAHQPGFDLRCSNLQPKAMCWLHVIILPAGMHLLKLI